MQSASNGACVESRESNKVERALIKEKKAYAYGDAHASDGQAAAELAASSSSVAIGRPSGPVARQLDFAPQDLPGRGRDLRLQFFVSVSNSQCTIRRKAVR